MFIQEVMADSVIVYGCWFQLRFLERNMKLELYPQILEPYAILYL